MVLGVTGSLTRGGWIWCWMRLDLVWSDVEFDAALVRFGAGCVWIGCREVGLGAGE